MKNKKVVFHEFNPVLYPLKLWVVKNPTGEAIKNRFEEHNGKPINADFRDIAVASTYNRIVCDKQTNKFGILISIHSTPSVGSTAHESTHAARFIWDWLDEVEPSAEADAYLVGWIADCIWQVKTNKFRDE